MSKLLFIYNPNAGKGSIQKSLSEIIEKVAEKGYSVTVQPTFKQGDGTEFTEKLGSEYDVLLCAGGDGTLNEVVNGLMKIREKGDRLPCLAYIPAGTVNDFATSHKIPKEVTGAIEVVVNGEDLFYDVGEFSSKKEGLVSYFTYVAAFGAFTEISYATSQEAKNFLGKVAYFLEGLKSLQKIKPYHVKIEYDEGSIEDEFVFGMVANSKSVGGFKGLTGPEVYLDDGEFDVILVREPKNPLDFQNIISSFMNMDMSSDFICHFHSKTVRIEPTEELQWTLDGEDGGLHGEVIVKNHKKAIEVRIPKEEAEIEEK